MKLFWAVFFVFWAIAAFVVSWISPSMGWWFPSEAGSPLGQQIDDLFYLILWIVSITFVGTHIALGYVLFRGAKSGDSKAWFSHGSHSLEVIWTIVPAGILLFIALYQMDVWAQYRIIDNFPEDARNQPIAEVTARQFEWRIRYPAPDRVFKGQKDIERWLAQPEPGDLYTVNDLRAPTGRPVMFYLRTQDVQHSFFAPDLRVKQDALPGLVIPVWFEAIKGGEYSLLCAELCGWGHYKMKARIVAESELDLAAYWSELQASQFDDGFSTEDSSEEAE